MADVPEVGLDRSVNLESNAFIGSILEGVVSTEGDEAGGAAEAEVAFTLSKEEKTSLLFTAHWERFCKPTECFKEGG